MMIPEKIHIRGVDDLTTEDIIAFAAEHFQSDSPIRIEWIDDTSANIVFSSSGIASDALSHFSIDHAALASSSPSQLRAAKPFSKHPESRLDIRIAFSTDQKKPRAHEASRFYMMHPEHDPREKRRHETGTRDHDYKRRRYDRREHRRRREGDDHEGFVPGMYDDDPTLNKEGSRRGSFSNHSRFSSEGRNTDGGAHPRHRRGGDYYRPRRLSESGRASRDRSASPDQAFEVRNARRRSPVRAFQSHRSNPPPAGNSGKELFPASDVLNKNRSLEGRELFPNKTSASILKKELFPNKTMISNHRRSDAFDAADETADLFASGLTVSNSTRASNRGPFITRLTTLTKDLQNSSESGTGSPPLEQDENSELNIRGASKLGSLGMSIRGAAGDGAWMRKSENAGKELFTEKLKRNKAMDMFY